MTYYPMCGSELEQVAPYLYRCNVCNDYYIVYFDSEFGDLYAVVRIPSTVSDHFYKEGVKRGREEIVLTINKLFGDEGGKE